MKRDLCIRLLIILTLSSKTLLAMESVNSTSQNRFLYGLYSVQGCRDEQEDTHCIDLYSGLSNEEAFFGIFDGHGGVKVAEIVASDLHTNLISIMLDDQLKSTDELGLKKAFNMTEQHISDCCPNAAEMGSTAVVAWIKSEKLIIGWLGDSRAVLSKNNNEVAWSSKDHKPNDPAERTRIFIAGGHSEKDSQRIWRVYKKGKEPNAVGFSLSRAFGDCSFKKGISDGPLSADPEIRVISLSDDNNQFLILACDGLWDVISNDEAVKIVNDSLIEYETQQNLPNKDLMSLFPGSESLEIALGKKYQQANSALMLFAASQLFKQAFRKGISDNISVIVVKLPCVSSLSKKDEAFPLIAHNEIAAKDLIAINKLIDELKRELINYEAMKATIDLDRIFLIINASMSSLELSIKMTNELITQHAMVGPEVAFIGKLIIAELEKAELVEVKQLPTSCKRWCYQCKQSNEWLCLLVPYLREVFQLAQQLNETSIMVLVQSLIQQLNIGTTESLQMSARSIYHGLRNIHDADGALIGSLRKNLSQLLSKIDSEQ